MATNSHLTRSLLSVAGQVCSPLVERVSGVNIARFDHRSPCCTGITRFRFPPTVDLSTSRFPDRLKNDQVPRHINLRHLSASRILGWARPPAWPPHQPQAFSGQDTRKCPRLNEKGARRARRVHLDSPPIISGSPPPDGVFEPAEIVP